MKLRAEIASYINVTYCVQISERLVEKNGDDLLIECFSSVGRSLPNCVPLLNGSHLVAPSSLHNVEEVLLSMSNETPDISDVLVKKNLLVDKLSYVIYFIFHI